MKRYLEFKDFLSIRFWEIELDDCTLIIRSGMAGNAGEEERKSFASFEKAVDAMESQVKRKLAQRFKEIGAEEPEPRKEVRYFEKLSGKDAEFIELSIDGKTLVRRLGDIGSVGKRQPFTFDSLAETQRNYDLLVKRLIKQGYQQAEVPARRIHEPESAYLEHLELRRFFEISENANALRIRRGELGRPCLVYEISWQTPDLGRANFERLLKEWQAKGFVRCSPSEAIIEGARAGQLMSQDIEGDPVYGQFFKLGWAQELLGKRKRLIHFAHGVDYDGDFDLEEIADMGVSAGLIISGDVRVSGVFSQLSYTYPASTLILGNVHAHSLGHADSHMRIQGDVHVDNIVYGHYNDGCLQIAGAVYGRLWISYDHDMSADEYHIYCLEWGETAGLSPKLLDLDGSVDRDCVREFMYARKNPLQRGFSRRPAVAPDAEPESEPESPAQPEPETPAHSALYQQVRRLAEAGDVPGMTDVLENWPERNPEWAEYVISRLAAPSTTAAQEARLRAVFEAYKPGELARIEAAMQALVQAPDALEPVAEVEPDESSQAETPSRSAISKPKKKNSQIRNILEQIRETNKAASTLQATQPHEALQSYQQVIVDADAGLADFPDEFAYEYLFALQGQLWCINVLAEADAAQIPLAMQLARQILGFCDGQFNFHYSEAGALSRNAKTLANNTLAWYLLQDAQPEQALVHADAAIAEIDYGAPEETYATVLENKVRILLALKLYDDAYALVYTMHRKFPELGYFKEIARTAEYQRWNAEN